MTLTPQDMTPKTENNTYVYLAVSNNPSPSTKSSVASTYKNYFAWTIHAPNKEIADQRFWEDRGWCSPHVLVVIMKARGETDEHLICVANGLK